MIFICIHIIHFCEKMISVFINIIIRHIVIIYDKINLSITSITSYPNLPPNSSYIGSVSPPNIYPLYCTSNTPSVTYENGLYPQLNLWGKIKIILDIGNIFPHPVLLNYLSKLSRMEQTLYHIFLIIIILFLSIVNCPDPHSSIFLYCQIQAYKYTLIQWLIFAQVQNQGGKSHQCSLVVNTRTDHQLPLWIKVVDKPLIIHPIYHERLSAVQFPHNILCGTYRLSLKNVSCHLSQNDISYHIFYANKI